jgi:hydrogenase nickel incorporation protein HypB
MCAICGCGTVRVDAPAEHDDHLVHSHSEADEPHHQAQGRHAQGHHVHGGGGAHQHPDGAAPHHPSASAIDFGAGRAGVTLPGLSQERTLRIERDILSRNAAFAESNRSALLASGVFALNLLSSPGAGKTALLVRTISDLKDRWPISVIEGDQQTSRDADRIRQTGARAVQINTGKGCHLDAHMVGHALERLSPGPGGLLFIENVGNLVCPAAFDLGEACKVVVLSVTEGEDKPLKYPDMFAAAELMLLNKSDLLPHLDFDIGACLAAALRVNPHLKILTVSARTGAGLAGFYAWIEARAAIALGFAAEGRMTRTTSCPRG